MLVETLLCLSLPALLEMLRFFSSTFDVSKGAPLIEGLRRKRILRRSRHDVRYSRTCCCKGAGTRMEPKVLVDPVTRTNERCSDMSGCYVGFPDVPIRSTPVSMSAFDGRWSYNLYAFF